MEVIEVAVRNVDRVDFEEFRRDFDRRREMPPGSPVARTDHPGINEKPPAIALDEHACMAKNPKRKRHRGANGTTVSPLQ